MSSFLQRIRSIGLKEELGYDDIRFLILPLKEGFGVAPGGNESVGQIQDAVHEVLRARKCEVVELLNPIATWEIPEGCKDLELIAAKNEDKKAALIALEYLALLGSCD